MWDLNKLGFFLNCNAFENEGCLPSFSGQEREQLSGGESNNKMIKVGEIRAKPLSNVTFAQNKVWQTGSDLEFTTLYWAGKQLFLYSRIHHVTEIGFRVSFFPNAYTN